MRDYGAKEHGEGKRDMEYNERLHADFLYTADPYKVKGYFNIRAH